MPVDTAKSYKRKNRKLLIISISLGSLALIAFIVAHLLSQTLLTNPNMNMEALYILGIVLDIFCFITMVFNMIFSMMMDKISWLWLLSAIAFCQSILSIILGNDILIVVENEKLAIGIPEYSAPIFLSFVGISTLILIIAILKSIRRTSR